MPVVPLLPRQLQRRVSPHTFNFYLIFQTNIPLATPAKAAGTSGSRKRATPAKSTPRKRVKAGTPLSSARVEDGDSEDANHGTPETPIVASTRAKRAAKGKAITYADPKDADEDSGSELEDKSFKEEVKEEEEATETPKEETASAEEADES